MRRSLAGRLGVGTFVRRIDQAYAAKTHEELEDLTRDLPHRLTLGRSPHCGYVVGDRTVSARHAELRRTTGGWALRDLGSRNGTRVNGWLVKERRLADGDEIALGTSAFVFREP